jgi:DNA-binding response OmpR family regulator
MTNSKIMIVDDDPDLRQALRLRLRANHYDTVNAVDGYSAIALAYKEHPDLISLISASPPETALSSSTACKRMTNSQLSR